MTSVQLSCSEQLQSKVISFLRFPLIVGVVMIHVNMSLPQDAHFPIYDFTKVLTSSVLAAIAVPLFFMFSGYLFFYKVDIFTIDIYENKVKKRARTLLVPYVFWNLMFVLYYLLGRFLGLGSQYGIGFTWIDWLKPFWNVNEAQGATGDLPVSIQFWYIRDLIMMVLLSPVIYWLTRRLRYGLVLFFGVLWLADIWRWHVTGFSITAFTFFSLGAYFSICRKNFVEIVEPYALQLGVLYAVYIVLRFVVELDMALFERLGIVLGMAFVVSVAARFVTKGTWDANKLLSESSFFIFAFHMLALTIIEEVVPLNLSFGTDVILAFMYLFWSTSIVVGGLVLYYFLKKYMPRFAAIITGGR